MSTTRAADPPTQLCVAAGQLIDDLSRITDGLAEVTRAFERGKGNADIAPAGAALSVSLRSTAMRLEGLADRTAAAARG